MRNIRLLTINGYREQGWIAKSLPNQAYVGINCMILFILYLFFAFSCGKERTFFLAPERIYNSKFNIIPGSLYEFVILYVAGGISLWHNYIRGFSSVSGPSSPHSNVWKMWHRKLPAGSLCISCFPFGSQVFALYLLKENTTQMHNAI